MGMTNEEAWNRIDSIIAKYEIDDEYVTINNEKDYDALRMARKILESQPCEDYISREQTLKAFAEKCGGECACCEYNGSGYDTAENCKLIKSMPSVTPQHTRWIPCSERLPNAYEFVNCTCHSLIDDREDWVIETVYIPQPSDSPYSDWGNIPMLNSGDCKVVAWMHRDIPEPYKAKSEEEK